DAQRSHSALAAATATAESARREHAALEQALQSPEHQQLLIHVKSELVRLNAEAETRKQAIASQREAIAAQRPELFEQDVKRFRASAEEAERLFQQRRQLIATARGQLQGEGALGLEEERAQLGGQLEQANRRQREMKLRADALSLLLELLTHERRELTRRLHAPLQQHVQRYLGVLMPGGAQLDIGDGLAPQALRRSAASGASSIAAFDDLSFGAREQMGVLSRLAYADLLKASGQPTLVILDDALVHSDAERLEQMKRVLFDAAQRHQILLFTCHPEIWRDIGAAPRSIGRPT
ncbi:MAG: GTP-binding protein, partial [Burkholderiaceae bacterium]